jgi:hypothetical protein
MKILRTTEMLHPILQSIVPRIQKEIIDQYNFPFKLFETGRLHERHNFLLQKGKTRDGVSRHLFNLTHNPKLYATAIDYVYFDNKWSWNLRDSSISSWYILFGNLVLDICPELLWGGLNRKSQNFNHFELKSNIIEKNLNKYPCILP